MNMIKKVTTFSNAAEYHPYDTNLSAVFEQIKNIIQQPLPGIQVEHVGSSSIPGVGGRNVIDIAIPTIDLDQTSIKDQLKALGFQDAPFRHFLPILIGSVSHQSKEYAILLYVLSLDLDVYKDWIIFRDFMRTHPDDAHAYDQVKQETIAAGKINGANYQQAKTPFLVSTMKKIKMSVAVQGDS